MNHVLSTHLFVNHRLSTVWLDKISHAGISAVEMFCARQHFDYRNPGQVAELGHWFRDSTMTLNSLHGPMYNDDVWGRTGPTSVINITETIKAKRIAVVDEIKRALEVAETIPFQYLIQHVGVLGEEYDERKLDAAFNSLEELSLFAHQRGVQILLENIANGMSSAERLVMFLNSTHLRLNFCFDVGHANMNEGVEAAFETMKEKIRSTHLHDNNGKSDSHLFPFHTTEGTIDWPRTMGLLQSRPDQYPLVLELKEVPAVADPFTTVTTAVRIFEKLESFNAASSNRD